MNRSATQLYSRLRRQIMLLMGLGIIVVMAPTAGLVISIRSEARVRQRIDQFHLKTVAEIQEAMIAIDDHFYPTPESSESQAPRLKSLQLVNQGLLGERIATVTTLQQQQRWSAAEATARRLEDTWESLSSISRQPGGQVPVEQLDLLRLRLNQLRLLHQAEQSNLLLIADREQAKLLSLVSLGGGGLALFALGLLVSVWSNLRHSLRSDTTTQVQLRTLIDALPDLIYFKDAAGRYQVVNRQMAVMAGKESETKMIGLLPEDCFPQPVASRFARADDKLLHSGDSQSIPEVPLTDPEGRTRWYVTRKVPLRDESGNLVGLVGIGHDITELREREMSFQNIFDQAAVGICYSRPDDTVIRVNGRLQRITGLNVVEILGQPLCAITHPNDRGLDRELKRELTAGQRGHYAIEKRVLRKDGSMVWCNFTVSLTRGVKGEPEYFITVMEDVTMRKTAELRLWESERSLRQAQVLGRLGSWELNLRPRALYWSTETYSIFGVRPDMTLRYEDFVGFVHPEDRSRVTQIYESSVELRETYECVYRIISVGGELKWVQQRGETAYGPDGTPLRSAGMVQDITETVLAREELQRSVAEKETLLREIHHRVKNNLQIVASLLFFQSEKVKDAGVREVFDDARERLRSMILVHEKLYQGDLSSVDFADYVYSLVDQLEKSTVNFGRRVRFTVTTNPLTLPIEKALPCGMILIELLTNAIKYAFPAGQEGKVDITVAQQADRARMIVHDQGIGISADFNPLTAETFGWQLIGNLVKQLDANCNLENTRGTRVSIDFAIGPVS